MVQPGDAVVAGGGEPHKTRRKERETTAQVAAVELFFLLALEPKDVFTRCHLMPLPFERLGIGTGTRENGGGSLRHLDFRSVW